jgi:hypothetical protein
LPACGPEDSVNSREHDRTSHRDLRRLMASQVPIPTERQVRIRSRVRRGPYTLSADRGCRRPGVCRHHESRRRARSAEHGFRLREFLPVTLSQRPLGVSHCDWKTPALRREHDDCEAGRDGGATSVARCDAVGPNWLPNGAKALSFSRSMCSALVTPPANIVGGNSVEVVPAGVEVLSGGPPPETCRVVGVGRP